MSQGVLEAPFPLSSPVSLSGRIELGGGCNVCLSFPSPLVVCGHHPKEEEGSVQRMKEMKCVYVQYSENPKSSLFKGNYEHFMCNV